MKTIFKIKRSTIRKNPDCNKGLEVIPTCRQMNLDMSFSSSTQFNHKMIDKLFAKFDCYLSTMQITFPASGLVGYQLQVRGRDFEKCQALVDLFTRLPDVDHFRVNFTVDQSYERIQSWLNPKYLYEYEKKELECFSCGHKGDLDSFDYDEAMACPKCDSHDCDYDYEDIDGVVEEMGGHGSIP